jgi:putative ABC transport system permease protein
MSYWSRIVNVFHADRLTREIDEELESHLHEAMEHGRDPEEVRRAFGPTLQRREQSRDIRVSIWLDSLRADVVFGWRQLRRNKAATAAAILSLGLAMGACVSAFRLIDALLLRPLPVAHPERLYTLAYPYVDNEGKIQPNEVFNYPEFRAIRAAAKNQAALIAISFGQRDDITFGSDDEMEKAHLQYVSGWMFDSFGLKPALGRLLTANDDSTPGANAVAVLSYDFWAGRFGRDPRVIGRKFRMGTDVYQIVGVCQQGFTGSEPGVVTGIFIPTMMNARAIDEPRWGWFRTFASIGPGVNTQVMLQKLRAADAAFRREHAKTMPAETPRESVKQYVDASLSLQPSSAGASGMQREYRRPLTVLGVVVLLVLLIACSNVANLMAGQAAARAREMALRVSIGAGRWRLIQLVMVESVLLALLATVVGSVLAWRAAPFVVDHAGTFDNPQQLVLSAGWRVLAFAGALALAVTLLFGAIPALQASAVKPMSTLRAGQDPHSRRRLMNALVAAQVTFCFLVCMVAGLFLGTFHQLVSQPTGFVAERLLTLDTVTRDDKPSPNWDEVRERLQNIGGVESTAFSAFSLMSGNTWTDGVWVDGRRSGTDEPYFLPVSPGWLHTMRIPVIDGRDFRPGDKAVDQREGVHDTSVGAAIVNRAFVRRYFEGRSPVGRSFELRQHPYPARYQIVGYADDARYFDMREPIRPTVYLPFDANAQPSPWGTFIVRTTAENALALAPALRDQVKRTRPEFRVTTIATQTALVEQHTVRERLLAILSLFFASLALLLAGIGLYGVLSYSVLQRRKELGIRIALGAGASDVARRVTAEIGVMLAVGAALGLAAGLSSQRFLEGLLFQVKATDTAMLAAPALTILAAAVLAAIPPVIRALRIDPAEMLRAE